MAVTYHAFRGKSLSDDWYAVLSAAAADGVYFILNSGHRTMDEQWYLYNGYRAGKPGFNLAAYPSETAPHIRVGRQDHALDINDNTVATLRGWLSSHGVRTHMNVPGETWHMEVLSASELHALADKLRAPKTPLARVRAQPLREGAQSKDVRLVQIYLRHLGYLPKDFQVAHEIGTYGPIAVRAVKAFQRHVGLKPDGIVGAKTFAALKRRYHPKRK